jgi:hypothetical protein
VRRSVVFKFRERAGGEGELIRADRLGLPDRVRVIPSGGKSVRAGGGLRAARLAESGRVFVITRQPSGTVISSVKRALRSGWSKQGNAVLASEGTNSV